MALRVIENLPQPPLLLRTNLPYTEHSSLHYIKGPPPQRGHKNESQAKEWIFPNSPRASKPTEVCLHLQLAHSVVTNNLGRYNVKPRIKISCILLQKSIKTKFLRRKKENLFSKQHRRQAVAQTLPWLVFWRKSLISFAALSSDPSSIP